MTTKPKPSLRISFFFWLSVLLFILMALFSCKKQALETTSDGDFEIEFLFEKDGVRMYRFTDNGELIYFWSDKDQPVGDADYYKPYFDGIRRHTNRQIEEWKGRFDDTLNLEQWR